MGKTNNSGAIVITVDNEALLAKAGGGYFHMSTHAIHQENNYYYVKARINNEKGGGDYSLWLKIPAATYAVFVAGVYALFAGMRYYGAKGNWYFNIPKSALVYPSAISSFLLNAPMAYVFFFSFIRFLKDIRYAAHDRDIKNLLTTVIGVIEGAFTSIISATILNRSAGKLLKLINSPWLGGSIYGASLAAFFLSMLTTRVYGGAMANRMLLNKSYEIYYWMRYPEYRQLFRLRWLMAKYVDKIDINIPHDFAGEGRALNFKELLPHIVEGFFNELKGGNNKQLVQPPSEMLAWLNWVMDWLVGLPGGVMLAHFMTPLFFSMSLRGLKEMGWKSGSTAAYAGPVILSALSNVFFYMLSLGLLVHVGSRFYSVGYSRFAQMSWFDRVVTLTIGSLSPLMAYLSGFGFAGAEDDAKNKGYGDVGNDCARLSVCHDPKKSASEIAAVDAGGVNEYSLLRFLEKYVGAFARNKFMPDKSASERHVYFQSYVDLVKANELLTKAIVNGEIDKIGGRDIAALISKKESEWRGTAKTQAESKSASHWTDCFFGKRRNKHALINTNADDLEKGEAAGEKTGLISDKRPRLSRSACSIQ